MLRGMGVPRVAAAAVAWRGVALHWLLLLLLLAAVCSNLRSNPHPTLTPTPPTLLLPFNRIGCACWSGC